MAPETPAELPFFLEPTREGVSHPPTKFEEGSLRPQVGLHELHMVWRPLVAIPLVGLLPTPPPPNFNDPTPSLLRVPCREKDFKGPKGGQSG